MHFIDNFSNHATLYAHYRPGYPKELFAFLASLCEVHHFAWDCATGNGQAAIILSGFFDHVYATDASSEQLQNAIRHPAISYKVTPAECSGLDSSSVDLITVATALHWFNLDLFYTEAKRVMKPNGKIAAWTYSMPEISSQIDRIVRKFHDETIGQFWQYQNHLVALKYTTIAFPFKRIQTPPFRITAELTLDEFIHYIDTWSAVQKFIISNGFNPTDALGNELKPYWPESSKLQVN